MRKADQIYLSLLREILENGEELANKRRSGHSRLQIPTKTLEFSMANGFPLIECRAVPFKKIVAELLWFLRGETETRFMVENDCRIWDQDAYNYMVNEGFSGSIDDLKSLDSAETGKSYPHQWRNFGGSVDQIRKMYDNFSGDLYSSRLVVSAWNPTELGDVALPACHNFFQIIGGRDGFTLSFNMRSVDVYLGLPFNIASYALLGKMVERSLGVKFLKLVVNLNCVHLYDNQIEAAQKLISRKFTREGTPPLEVELEKGLLDVLNDKDSVSVNHFHLMYYNPVQVLRVPMLAPDSDKVF